MRSRRKFLGEVGAVGATVAATPLVLAGQTSAEDYSATVALFGDYGSEQPGELAVAQLISRWNPDGLFTLGDNVYSGPNADPYEVMDRKAARFYQEFIDRGIFYPSLGNHDWGDPGRALLWSDGAGGTMGAWHDIFHPPGNGRYYDVRIGDLHVFVLDDYYREPDGNLRGSIQAEWLRTAAAASDASWKIVTHHYPAYVSPSGGFPGIRWPFAEWGIDASFAGHWHHYERVERDGMLYICSGLGGASISSFGTPIAESKKTFTGRHGSVRLRVSPYTFVSEFIDVDGNVQDSRTLTKPGPGAAPRPTTTEVQTTIPTVLPPTVEPTRPRPSTTQTPSTSTSAPASAAASTPSGSPAETRAELVALPEDHRNAVGRKATIVRLYLAAFLRGPDDGGLEYWTNSEFHLIDIADYFVRSVEFGERYQAVDDDRFLQILYRNVLGRDPDPAGRNYWLSLLEDRVPRGVVLLGFSDSVEFGQRTGVFG